jgi:transposase
MTAPPKQRHTAKRIYDRLRAEHGFDGGYSAVKEYVQLARSRARETFVPLAHPPGHAQVDFGEVIGGVRQKMHVFFMDLPHSDAPFIKAYPAETTEAFLDGHVSAFAFFGGVPHNRSSTTTPSSQSQGFAGMAARTDASLQRTCQPLS